MILACQAMTNRLRMKMTARHMDALRVFLEGQLCFHHTGTQSWPPQLREATRHVWPARMEKDRYPRKAESMTCMRTNSRQVML
jgi:hypothetical protein